MWETDASSRRKLQKIYTVSRCPLIQPIPKSTFWVLFSIIKYIPVLVTTDVERTFSVFLKRYAFFSWCQLFAVFPVLVPSIQISAMWGATHSSRSPRTGGREGRWTKAPWWCSKRSYFICKVIVLSCEQVTIGTDCSDVVLVTRWQKGQAVGEDLMAGNSVRLSSLLMTIAKLPFPQSLQHLGADLRVHTLMLSLSQQKVIGWCCDHKPGCFFQIGIHPEM